MSRRPEPSALGNFVGMASPEHVSSGTSSEPTPLRVALFSPYSLTLPGGVQNQVMSLGRALRRLGHEVRVLGPCDGAPPDTFVTPLGESLPTAANGSIAPIAPDPAAALRTIRALRDEEFDVLHLHEPLSPGPTMTALMMRTAPIVGTFHAAGDSASYRYLNRVVRTMADGIDIRVAVSRDAEDLAARYLGGRYRILPNAVELDQFFDSDPEHPRERSIFFCGRHEPRKGLEVLLHAHDLLDDDVELVIASEGPETARLRHEFPESSRRHWLGRISDSVKTRQLQSSAVFCAPALGGESFGIVLLEAMASGATVVASDIDGYRNVATHDVDARLVASDDPVALAAELRHVLGDDGLRQRLTDQGRSRARQFSMDALAAAYVDLYREAIASSADRDERAGENRSLMVAAARSMVSRVGRIRSRTLPS
jgi:phosphatidylinositol alpha-mannosyltransferase